MLRSDLRDYSDTYIIFEGKITVANPDNDEYGKKLALNYNPPFLRCVSKVNSTLIDNTEDLDVVMPMYN